MLDRALDVVFPPRCAGCAGVGWPFCRHCRLALVPLEPPWCRRCGRPTETAEVGCRDCPSATIDQARAAFLYDGPAKAAILRLKFSGWRSTASALADAVVAIGLPSVDAVTWVPLARRRLGERGYDQARALAVAVGIRAGVPTVRLCRRAVTMGSQARRSGAERRQAVRGVFAPIGRPVPPHVLLVDDVLTTGATAGDCARALRAGGARHVVLATAARSLDTIRVSAAARSLDSIGASARGKGRDYTRTCSRPGLWLPGDPPR